MARAADALPEAPLSTLTEVVLRFLLAGQLLTAGPSTACDPDLLDRDASQRVVEGDYAGAARSWAAAYACEPRPALLYGHGVALIRAGDCEGGVEVLREFQSLDVDEVDREAADGVIAECGPPPPLPVVDRTPPPEAVVAPEPALDDAPRREPSRPSTRWWNDRTGTALAVSGVVVATIGAGFFGGAHAQAGRDDLNEDDYDLAERRTRVFAGVGIGGLVVGGALLVGAAVRYAIVHRRRAADRRTADR